MQVHCLGGDLYKYQQGMLVLRTTGPSSSEENCLWEIVMNHCQVKKLRYLPPKSHPAIVEGHFWAVTTSSPVFLACLYRSRALIWGHRASPGRKMQNAMGPLDGNHQWKPTRWYQHSLLWFWKGMWKKSLQILLRSQYLYLKPS